MGGLMRLLFRNGFRKGVLGGSRPWLVVFGLAATVRMIQRINDRESEIVYSEKLEPGESIVIAHAREPR
jgi:hypothetical protein